MQRVRPGHRSWPHPALRSGDPDDGHLVLDQAAKEAAQYGLVYQLRSIEGIKAMSEGPAGPRQR